MDVLLNKLIQFYLNNMTNFAIYPNALNRVIPTKWRSYRDHRLCDVASPYAFIHSQTYFVGLSGFRFFGKAYDKIGLLLETVMGKWKRLSRGRTDHLRLATFSLILNCHNDLDLRALTSRTKVIKVM